MDPRPQRLPFSLLLPHRFSIRGQPSLPPYALLLGVGGGQRSSPAEQAVGTSAWTGLCSVTSVSKPRPGGKGSKKYVPSPRRERGLQDLTWCSTVVPAEPNCAYTLSPPPGGPMKGLVFHHEEHSKNSHLFMVSSPEIKTLFFPLWGKA